MATTAPARTSEYTIAQAPVAAPALEVPKLVALLEEEIVFGRLHPRERLVEDDLMERFGVKRHAVREALAILERLGLVERRRNVGALVRSFSAREVEELYDVRTLLETEAVRQIKFPVSPDRLDALAAVQAEHAAAVKSQDVRRVFRSNQAFHQALFGLTPNETLQRAIAEYARLAHPIRFASLVSPDYRERARTEHAQMIEALRRADRKALIALCAGHLLPSRDAYLSMNRLQLEDR